MVVLRGGVGFYGRGTPVPWSELDHLEQIGGWSTAPEPSGNNAKYLKDFDLEAKARIWF
jgi:hypothetical protein